MKQKVIIIPGNGDSTPQDNWIPYCKRELEKRGIPCLTPQFPDTPLARYKYWIPFLQKLQADENTILVGHSTGAVAAMRYAEKYKIYGSILIGAYYTHLNIEWEKASGYFDRPWNWQAVRTNQQWSIIFSSTDDPWIPIEEPRFVQQQLQSEYYEFHNKGHFCGDYEKQKFPELVFAILGKLQCKQP